MSAVRTDDDRVTEAERNLKEALVDYGENVARQIRSIKDSGSMKVVTRDGNPCRQKKCLTPR